MTAKEALELLETIYDIGDGKPHRIFNGALDFEEQEQVIKTINQSLTELEAIKSADGGEALEAIDNLISITLSGNRLISNVRNYILKAQAQERELAELRVFKTKITKLVTTKSYVEFHTLLEEVKELCKGSEE